MNISRTINIVGLALLLYFSLEIIWRRLIWEQIPSQIPSLGVWGLLVINAFYLIGQVVRQR